MSDRLQRKIDETKAIADQYGIDLRDAPLLVTFEMPFWGTGIATHEIAELARHPGTAVAVTSPDPMPVMRRTVAAEPNLHVSEVALV